jgi:isoquinoline 1-oxidoreductase beta subunit
MVDAVTVPVPDLDRGLAFYRDGLGHALYGELLFEKGATVQKNFNTYKLIRMPDVPTMEVKFIDSSENPQGLGEPGLPPVAAAVNNAVFHATGQRIRKLPLSLVQLSSS